MRWPIKKILLALFVLLLLSVPPFSQATDSQIATFTGKVVGVSDGDTIKVMREGRAVKVRLYGIDCPEKKQAFGTQARRFTSDSAFRNEVTVHVKDTDRYGRIVGEVMFPDGSSLNKELVHAGLAWWYRRYAPDDRTLKALETGARTAKKGLWADKNPIPPWEWRKGIREFSAKKGQASGLYRGIVNYSELIRLVRDIALIVAVLIAAVLAIFVSVKFAPQLQPQITQHWVDESKGLLILKLEIQNNSGVRVSMEKIQLQILEHKLPSDGWLSEWVPFDKKAILPYEQPKEWCEPIEIFKSTEFLDPRETISIERLCRCPQDSILHVGLQVMAKLGLLGRLSLWFRRWKKQRTSTVIVMPPTRRSQ